MSTTYLPGSKLGRLALTAVASGALAVALTGCGGGDSRPELTSNGSSSSTSSSDTSSESETTDSSPTDTETTEPVDPETAGVFDIAVGDCLVEADLEGEVSDVPVVPCDQPHDSEVFLSIIMDDAPSYPGPDAVDAASEGCTADGFTQFVGIDYGSSAFYTSTLAPTEESWDSGDREILCLIYEPDVQTTGTLRGAGR